jgi:myo-inositol 2-dehydrogenase/D-chiro-inositol 1-dehydrogenase
MTEKVRVGIIGAGRMGRHHCQNLALRVPAAELAAVADIEAGSADWLAALAPGVYASADHRQLLEDPTIAAVLIATPNDTHAGLVREAAEAAKHVFCEKPLALDLDGADAALAAVAAAGVKLQIGFQRRFDPAYREARRIIEAGELGAVELVSSTTRDPSPPSAEYMRNSGGLFLDTLVHDLDSILFLTGLRAVEVYSAAATLFLPDGRDEGLVDTAITTLRLETGALAVVTNSLRAAYGYEVGAEVLGEKGKVVVGQERLTEIRRYGTEGVSTDHVVKATDRFREAFVSEIADFVDCLLTGREPQVSGEDGRAALQLALLAAQSSSEGRPLAVRPWGWS